MKFVLILLGVIAVSGCSTRNSSTAYGDLPPSLLLTCGQAVELPTKELSVSEVKLFWLKDRQELASCRSRHSGLVRAITPARNRD